MYETYWGLSRPPFPAAIEPDAFVGCLPHQTALLKLRYCVESRLGAAALTGDIGSGKTTLAMQLARELPEPFGPFIHVVFPRMGPAELMAWLAVELGADEQLLEQSGAGVESVLRPLQDQLAAWTARGRHPVLLIDEAHLLDNSRVLETLTLLLNFRTPPGIDFTLMLVGQTALSGILTRVPHLGNRLALSAQLRPLSHDETVDYVSARLAAAGCDREPFAADALATIHTLSGGLPRTIHRLCDLSLLVGYADGLDPIRGSHVHEVAIELPQASLARAC